MHQVSRTVDSITLSWSQPDQPNGVILDYELQYYEKVPLLLGALPPCTSLGPGVPSSHETQPPGAAEREHWPQSQAARLSSDSGPPWL